MTDLERSHDELRAALVLAGKRIRKLSFGRRDDAVLRVLRRVLRDARTVTRVPATRLRIPLRLSRTAGEYAETASLEQCRSMCQGDPDLYAQSYRQRGRESRNHPCQPEQCATLFLGSLIECCDGLFEVRDSSPDRGICH